MTGGRCRGLRIPGRRGPTPSGKIDYQVSVARIKPSTISHSPERADNMIAVLTKPAYPTKVSSGLSKEKSMIRTISSRVNESGSLGEYFPITPSLDKKTADPEVYRQAYDVHHGAEQLSLIHISEPTRLGMISYAVFCL